LNKKLFIFINSRVMLIWNMWIEKKLINDVMNAIRDIFKNDHVDNSLHHISTMLLIQFNDYNKSTSSKINDVNVIFMIFKINQWKNDDMICSRIQFSLILIFAISIHKNQKLTLSLMMFNFRRFDDCSRQNYIALSRIKSIEYIAFKSRFFYDHFFKKISKTVIKRIQNARTKQEFEVQINVLNVLENMNSFQKFECISSQFIIIEDVIVQDTNVVFSVQCSSIFERCLHLSLIEAIRTYYVEQIHVLIDVFVDVIRFFLLKIEKKWRNLKYIKLIFFISSLKWSMNSRLHKFSIWNAIRCKCDHFNQFIKRSINLFIRHY
jgi:hypothetical protein